MGWILTLLLQDKYDGWGEAFYLNGSVYVGCWQLGKRTGFGISKHFRSNGDCKEIYTGKYLPIPSGLWVLQWDSNLDFWSKLARFVKFFVKIFSALINPNLIWLLAILDNITFQVKTTLATFLDRLFPPRPLMDCPENTNLRGSITTQLTSSLIWDCNQCDQIGRFLVVLGNKVPCKSSPNI